MKSGPEGSCERVSVIGSRGEDVLCILWSGGSRRRRWASRPLVWGDVMVVAVVVMVVVDVRAEELAYAVGNLSVV